MNLLYPVKLSETERSKLKQLVSSGTAPARKLRRVHILLKSDSSEGGPNWSYKAIQDAFGVCNVTISAVRRAYAKGGLEAALNRKQPDRVYEHRLDGEAEAHLIALACSEAPEGQDRWTLRLLSQRMVQLGIVDSLCHETVRTTLKKTNSSRG